MKEEVDRVTSLDGLRGLCILLVIVYHCTYFSPEDDFGRVVLSLASYGWMGVDLFFVLSGFLITGILVDCRSCKPLLYFRNFYARRALRLFPVLYLLLVCLELATIAGNCGNYTRIEHWPYWLGLANFAVAVMGFRAPIDVTWSLAVEEQFYAIWSLIVYALAPKRLLWLSLAIIVISPLLRLLALEAHLDPTAVYVVLRFDSLMAGAMLALLVRDKVLNRHLDKLAKPLVIGACLAALAAIALSARLPSHNDRIVQLVGYSLNALLAVQLILLCLKPPEWAGQIFASNFLCTLGRFSYTMYLIHLFLIRVLLSSWRSWQPAEVAALVWQLFFYPVMLVITCTASWLIWHAYEKHFLKFKRHFPMTPDSACKEPGD